MLLLYLHFVLIGSAHAIYGSENCLESEVRSLADYTNQAHQQINSWRFELNRSKYKELSLFNRSKINLARNVLSCIDRHLDELVYECNAIKGDDGYEASTIPIVTRRVKLNEYFFIRNSKVTKIGLLIHEASHKCGTTDVAYFRGTVAKSTKFVPWPLIADTYEYWAKYGFCLPDVDC